MTELETLVTRWLFGDDPPDAEVVRAVLRADPDAAARLLGDLDELAAAFGADVEDARCALEGLLERPELTEETAALRWLFEGAPAPDADPALWDLHTDLEQLRGLCLSPTGHERLDDALNRLEVLLEGAPPRRVEPVIPDSAPVVEPVPAAAPRTRRKWPWALLAAAAVVAVWALRPAPTPAPAPVAGQPMQPPQLPQPKPAERRFEPLPATHLRPAMQPIQAGTFFMGSPPDEVGRNTDESRVRVTLTQDYWLARTEVTQAQWRAVMGNSPGYFKIDGDDRPVEQVNWFEAAAFANALSRREELPECYQLDCTGEPGGETLFTCESASLVPDCVGYRLPTEAEWEYAARAGTTSAVYSGTFELRDVRDAPALEAIAWYSGNSGVAEGGMACAEWTGRPRHADQCGTHPVATKRANDWGLHDMIGNVWEWTGDWYAAERQGGQDPTGPVSGRRRVTKGCGWYRDARFCRAANRYRPLPTYRSSVVGFRVARTRR